jgi:hypothetical protein
LASWFWISEVVICLFGFCASAIVDRTIIVVRVRASSMIFFLVGIPCNSLPRKIRSVSSFNLATCCLLGVGRPRNGVVIRKQRHDHEIAPFDYRVGLSFGK